MVWEYNMGIDTSKSNIEGRTMEQINAEGSVAFGWTDDMGNTQVNRKQINLALPFTDSWDSNGQLTIDNPATRKVISSTGVHEDGHTLGGRHETDPNISPALQTIQQAQPSSLMNTGVPGSNVSPQQRTDFIKRVGEQ